MTYGVGRPVLACCISLVSWHHSRAETIDQFVLRQQGVDFGPCKLEPAPKLKGSSAHAVIPARFEIPGVWVTRTLLLVGVDEAGEVKEHVALRLRDDVSPREVLSLRCSGERLEVRLTRKTLMHVWTGKELRPGGGRRER